MAEHKEWIAAQKRALLEAKVQREIARHAPTEMAASSLPSSTLPGAPYSESSGFVVFWDFAGGMPRQLVQCTAVYAFYDGHTPKSDVKSLPPTECEPEPGGLTRAIFSLRRQFLHMEPHSSVQLVVEVQQVAALCRVYPPETLSPEQAAAFMRSAAALRQYRAVLEWWPAVRGQFEDCDDHALRALLRLGRWEEAYALLGTAREAGTLRHAQLRRVAAACVRAAQGGAARRALRLALEVGLADGGLVRDALRASAAAAAAAPNATAAAQEGAEAVAALHAAEDAGCVSAASAPGVCRAAAEVYIQLGQHEPALLQLRTLRTLRAPRPRGAASGARPTRLALRRRQIDTSSAAEHTHTRARARARARMAARDDRKARVPVARRASSEPPLSLI